MPLLTVAGLPLSGKSFQVQLFMEFLEPKLQSLGMSVSILSAETLGIDKGSAADFPVEEKAARGKVLAAAERALSPRTLVIVNEAATGTKGLRYQLYCLARAAQTPTATLFVAAPEALLKKRFLNCQSCSTTDQEGYSEDGFTNLSYRFEEPDEHKNRWDSPLFTLCPSDGEFREGDSLESIQAMHKSLYESLFGSRQSSKRILSQSPATLVSPPSSPNYLAQVEALVSEALQYIAERQRNGFYGGSLLWAKVPGTPFQLPSRTLSSLDQRKIKKQFLQIQKGALSLEMIPKAFVEYVNLQFRE